MRARRRLIGAVVLLGVGVIAFPLLFETEPRPIPVDLPIEIPKKDAVPPLAMPAPASAPTRPATMASAASAPAPAPIVAEAPAEPAPAPTAPPPASAAALPKPVPPAASAPPRDDAARAQALLEGRTPASAAAPAGGRFVVQIGAFAEAKTVREVRAKAEKAGLVTYTQVVTVAAGERTRVRLGPFASREEAEAAAAKAKKAGLPASVIRL